MLRCQARPDAPRPRYGGGDAVPGDGRLGRVPRGHDLTFARNGDLYFTDRGQTGLQDPTGRVYRLRPSGELTCLVNTIPSPHGIVIDDCLGSLFVAVTRAKQIWRIPLNSSGPVAKVGVFSQFHGGLGRPDGIALDAEGCLIVAHTGFGSI